MPDRLYRVLVIASHPVQYYAPLLRRMAQRTNLDLQVAYCTLRGAEPAHDHEFGKTVQWDVPLLDGYAWTHIPNRGSGSEGFFGLLNPGLWKMIREGKFDAILCFSGYIRATFWIAYLAARLSGTAFLFGTDATVLTPRDGRKWKRVVKRIFWPVLFRLADEVIVPSAATVEMMRSLGIPEDRVTLTPFVIDNDWWTARAAQVDRPAVRASWGASPDDLVILFCAKLQPWKRPMDLLRAFAKAKIDRGILVFAGEGPLRSQLETEAGALGVASRVRFLGFANQSELPAIYSSADFFVLPSDYDSCPVVVCEAMLCGLPVVLSDEIRGRFDLVRPGVTGEIFPCGDRDALASTLRSLADRPSLLAAMKNNAAVRMATFSLKENIDATISAVVRAVARKKKGTTERAEVRTVPQEALSESAAETKISK